MILQTKVIRESEDSTVSELYVDGVLQCFILEDGYNDPKIWGETRIPHGIYNIQPRYQGKFFKRYKARFNHPFSLQLMEVPNFQYILMHIGNRILDTHGCLLTGSRWGYDRETGDYLVRKSTDAYKELYEKIYDYVLRGDCKIAVDRSASKYEHQNPILISEIW